MPKPGHGQVVVRMHAMSLNYRDLIIAKSAMGKREKPVIPVSDGAGEVVAVGGVALLGYWLSYYMVWLRPGERVLVKNVSGLHPLLANCLRLTVGTPEENALMIDALKASL